MPRCKKKKDLTETSVQSNWQLYIIISLLLIQTVFLFYKNYDFIKDIFRDDPNLSYSEETKQIQKSLSPVKNDNSVYINPKNVRVNILNGCGVSGAASIWKEKLREMKYDIRETGNADRKYNKTIILSRIEDMSYAKHLAKSLGITDENVLMQLNKDLVDIDLTLILGSDHKMIESK